MYVVLYNCFSLLFVPVEITFGKSSSAGELLNIIGPYTPRYEVWSYEGPENMQPCKHCLLLLK